MDLLYGQPLESSGKSDRRGRKMLRGRGVIRSGARMSSVPGTPMDIRWLSNVPLPWGYGRWIFLYYEPCTTIPFRAAGDNTTITLVRLELEDQCEQFQHHVCFKHLPDSGKNFQIYHWTATHLWRFVKNTFVWCKTSKQAVLEIESFNNRICKEISSIEL